MATATMTSTPTAKFCHSGSKPAIVSPLMAVPTMMAPISVPRTPPRPPNRLVPPMTTAVIDLEIGRLERLRARGIDATEQEPGAERVEEAGHGVDAQQQAVDPDPGQARRLGIVAGGVDVAPPRGEAQDVHHHARRRRACRSTRARSRVEDLDGPRPAGAGSGPCPCRARSRPRDVNRLSAKKMLIVPRVTMNGGILSRVMSRPLRRPQAVPKANPRTRASRPGTPERDVDVGHDDRAKTAMAPTERSTPAVRMMIVWPMASVPTTVTWDTMSDRLRGRMNRSGAMRLNAHDHDDQDDERAQRRVLVERPLDAFERRRPPPLFLVDRCPSTDAAAALGPRGVEIARFRAAHRSLPGCDASPSST